MSTPRELGRYKILRSLGKGGMGEVFLARWQGAAGFQKTVALKVLGEGFADDPGRARGLLREAFLGAELDHEHVVGILDLDELDGRFLVAMEYVRGFNLGNVLDDLNGQKAHIPVGQAVHLARALAKSLDYVHAYTDADGKHLGLIHGDVTPSNVLLGIDGKIKLTDFGVTALASEIDHRKQVVGKFAYLPPEAFRGALRDQSWDIYSLAVVFYEMLAGVPPFLGRTMAQVQSSMIEGAAPVETVRAECPTALARICAKGIARESIHRYATAADFLAALDAAHPPTIEDTPIHKAFISGVFTRPGFIARHGDLPSTGGYAPENELAPFLEETAARRVVTEAPARRTALRIGLSPAMGPTRARAAGDRIGTTLAKALGRSVRPVVLGDYHTLVDWLIQGELDLAWMPPIPFVHAVDRGATLVAAISRAGHATYDAAIFVRVDSPIFRIEELVGQSMAWVDRESAGGYLFAAAALTRALGDLRKLGSQHFHGSHRTVCEAVINGWATAGTSFCVRGDQGEMVRAAWDDFLPAGDANDLRPIAFAGPIPGDNIAARPFLPDKLCEEIHAALLDLPRLEGGADLLTTVFHADKFVDLDIEAYEGVREALSALGKR